MKKLILASAACLAMLAGCASDSGKGLADAAGTILSTVQQACAVYSPVAASLATVPDMRASALATYGNAVCGPTGSVVAGFEPDAGTAAWVGALTGSLRALASSPVLVKPPVSG
jgi:hypothetical protein